MVRNCISMGGEGERRVGSGGGGGLILIANSVKTSKLIIRSK